MQEKEFDSRYEIMKLLKIKSRPISEISDILGISPTAVRQHIAILEGNGLVGKSPFKEKMGRPKFLYFLTEKSEEFFPKAYSKLLEWLIEDIVKSRGIDELNRVMGSLGKKQALDYKSRFSSKSVNEDCKTLVEVLKERKMFVEVEKKDGSIIIKQYNCLFHDISKKFGNSICEFDSTFFRTLIDARIKVLTCMASGDRYCSFEIFVEE